MTQQLAKFRLTRMFLLPSAVALLLTANNAQAMNCDSKICTSDMTVTLKDGKCYYSWPTLVYEVPKLTQPMLYWRIVTANYKWDLGNGVRLYGEMNDDNQDLKNGHGESDTVFTWEAVQAPIDPSPVDKVFLIRMNIYYNGATCDKANGEPDYRIVLKR